MSGNFTLFNTAEDVDTAIRSVVDAETNLSGVLTSNLNMATAGSIRAAIDSAVTIDTDLSSGTNTDTAVPSALAVKTYVDGATSSSTSTSTSELSRPANVGTGSARDNGDWTDLASGTATAHGFLVIELRRGRSAANFGSYDYFGAACKAVVDGHTYRTHVTGDGGEDGYSTMTIPIKSGKTYNIDIRKINGLRPTGSTGSASTQPSGSVEFITLT